MLGDDGQVRDTTLALFRELGGPVTIEDAHSNALGETFEVRLHPQAPIFYIGQEFVSLSAVNNGLSAEPLSPIVPEPTAPPLVAAPVVSFNAPEAPTAQKAEPAAPPPPPAEDRFDSMDAKALRDLAAQHHIDVKGLREKNLRIKVRDFFNGTKTAIAEEPKNESTTEGESTEARLPTETEKVVEETSSEPPKRVALAEPSPPPATSPHE
jgi:hypothetical protein